jgi:hypothetical protein
LKLSEEEKKNLKVVNISKKPIKVSKQMEEPKKAQEVQMAQVIQKAQVAKEARKAKLQLKAKEILQALRKVAQLEMELEWAKALQVETGPSSLSMNAMVEARKVLQTLVVNKKKTNIQLSLELK